MKYYIVKIEVPSAIKPGKKLIDLEATTNRRKALELAARYAWYKGDKTKVKIIMATPNGEIEF